MDPALQKDLWLTNKKTSMFTFKPIIKKNEFIFVEAFFFHKTVGLKYLC